MPRTHTPSSPRLMVLLCPSPGIIATEPPLLIPLWDQSMGSSGFTTLGLTAGGSPELPNPRLLANGNRRLHSATLFWAGMGPNSYMRALQCINTAGELGGFKENFEGISHPLTLHTSLIAATSTGFTL